MITDDSSTLTFPPAGELTGAVGGLALVPAVTIIWHPDLDRVGEVAPLTALLEDDVPPLSRDQPICHSPGSSDGQSVDHRGMSRKPPVPIRSSRAPTEGRIRTPQMAHRSRAIERC